MQTIVPRHTPYFLAAALLLIPSLARAWSPGYVGANRIQSYDFAVNNEDRNDVVAFWQAVYQGSEGYQNRVQWTGNYSGNNGSVSAVFVDDVERRVNYFRTMCGLDSLAKVNTSSTVFVESSDPFQPDTATQKVTAVQNAAMMMVRNYNSSTGQNPALTHSPGRNLVGWSTSAWNAAARGNFAFGLYGPGAMTEYIVEQLPKSSATSSWNTLVGHRRWILNPNATSFATGDQPGTSAYIPPTNVLYVVQRPDERQKRDRTRFVSYPSAGFFPAPINTPYWSLSCANADFHNAQVTMTDANGSPVPVTNAKASNEYADPAIIWQPASQATRQSVYEDATYKIQVSGITGEGVPSSYAYQVTLINPDRLTFDQQISGAASQSAGQSSTYAFNPPEVSEGLQLVSAIRTPATWKEDAESAAKLKITNANVSGYSLTVRPTSYRGFGKLSGKTAFHLTFPKSYDLLSRSVPEQSFELDREIIAKAGARLKFQFRRGFMTKGSTLAIEATSDGGVTWNRVAQIKGISDTRPDSRATKASYALAPSDVPWRLRFRYFIENSTAAIYTNEAARTSPTGIFFDDITVTGCDSLETKATVDLPSGTRSFAFSPASAGAPLTAGSQWQLRLRTRLGGKWFAPGPAKPISITP